MIFTDRAGARRIESYFAWIGEVLGNAKRRSSFAVYAMGLLGNAGSRISRVAIERVISSGT